MRRCTLRSKFIKKINEIIIEAKIRYRIGYCERSRKRMNFLKFLNEKPKKNIDVYECYNIIIVACVYNNNNDNITLHNIVLNVRRRDVRCDVVGTLSSTVFGIHTRGSRRVKKKKERKNGRERKLDSLSAIFPAGRRDDYDDDYHRRSRVQ